jgi:hypothetical protein
MLNLRKYNILPLLILVAVLAATISSANLEEQTLEWKAHVGDIRNYTVTKYHNSINDTDSDHAQDEITVVTGVTELGVNLYSNYTLKQGTTMKIEVMQSAGEDIFTGLYYIGVVITYNSQVRAMEQPDFGYYNAPTVDNQTYWEVYAATYPNTTLEGDFIVITTESTSAGMSTSTILKRNWRTGWLSSMLNKISDQTGTIYEYELSEDTSKGTNGTDAAISPSFELILVISALVSLSFIISKSRSKKKLS